MFTIKQLESFYWVARLGTIAKAADKLHVTQSAITKRMQELQASVAAPLFERGSRKNLLTSAGKELQTESENIFELLEQLEKMKRSSKHATHVLHIGLGEMTALTWFPAFLKRMKDVYPGVTIQPEIDQSTPLFQKVMDGRLEFAILPEMPDAGVLAQVPIGDVQFGWLSAPGRFEEDVCLSLPELSAHPVIEQSQLSIITRLCAQMWEGAGVQPERINGGNNIVALAGLVAAGVGISCLPLPIFEKEIAQGKLRLIKTNPPAPSVTYSCYFPRYPNSALGYSVAAIAKQTCTFMPAL